jgi:hypothetical protein
VTTTLTIDERFCGPPGTGNGGYTAGRLASVLGEAPVLATEVTLRAPAPIGRPLTVVRAGDGARLLDGDVEVATARRVPLTVDVPPPVGAEVARAIVAESPMLRAPAEHPFPGCFVCGPGRAAGDGLRLFPARVPGRDVYAVSWVATEVSAEFVWAVLDCPSSFPMYLDEDPFAGPVVLGRIAARIDALPVAGAECVVMSWREAVDGRKMFSASALLHGNSTLAVARAIWIRL